MVFRKKYDFSRQVSINCHTLNDDSGCTGLVDTEQDSKSPEFDCSLDPSQVDCFDVIIIEEDCSSNGSIYWRNM